MRNIFYHTVVISGLLFSMQTAFAGVRYTTNLNISDTSDPTYLSIACHISNPEVEIKTNQDHFSVSNSVAYLDRHDGLVLGGSDFSQFNEDGGATVGIGTNGYAQDNYSCKRSSSGRVIAGACLDKIIIGFTGAKPPVILLNGVPLHFPYDSRVKYVGQ